MKRREEVKMWDLEGTDRMAHTCLSKFTPLAEEKFLLFEVAEMYKIDPGVLKTAASDRLKRVAAKAAENCNKEVGVCMHNLYILPSALYSMHFCLTEYWFMNYILLLGRQMADSCAGICV